MTSVGDDVWRRIFDRLWLPPQAAVSLVIKQMQHRCRKLLCSEICVLSVECSEWTSSARARTGKQRRPKAATLDCVQGAPLLSARGSHGRPAPVRRRLSSRSQLVRVPFVQRQHWLLKLELRKRRGRVPSWQPSTLVAPVAPAGAARRDYCCRGAARRRLGQP